MTEFRSFICGCYSFKVVTTVYRVIDSDSGYIPGDEQVILLASHKVDQPGDSALSQLIQFSSVPFTNQFFQILFGNRFNPQLIFLLLYQHRLYTVVFRSS